MAHLIRSVNYNNSKDAGILEACLSKWFRNPKDLNLAAPKIRFPFKFTQWKSYYLEISSTKSFVVEDKGWIVGHISLRYLPANNRAHIFHLIISPESRGSGLGKLLIARVESEARLMNCVDITLFVAQTNETAINLYENLGYKKQKQMRGKSFRMLKSLENEIPR